MIRLLVLDDDTEFYDQLVTRLNHEEMPRFVCQRVASVDQARDMVTTTMNTFDLFLINFWVAGPLDGIEVMKELLKISPTSDAIIKSHDFNANRASRAVFAGATRFFSIQFSIDELLLTFRSLYEKRRAEEEREWFKILNEAAEATQHSGSIKEVGRIVVEGALRLGFERARLWLLDDKQNILVGIDQAGTEGFENFSDLRIPVDQSVDMQHILSSREPVFFKGFEQEEGYLYSQSEEQGFTFATGEWVSIPLWSSNRCLGKLSFSRAEKSKELRPAQREFLSLFGKQVAAVVERVQLQEEKARKSDELKLLQEMNEAQEGGEASQRELKILHRVLEEALGDTDKERLIKALFYAARDLLHIPHMRLILCLRQWSKALTTQQEPCEVRCQYLLNEDGILSQVMEEQLYRGIIGLTLKTGKSQLVPNVHDKTWPDIYYNHDPYPTQSELDVPIKLGKKVIGVFKAESPQLGAFTPAHQATFERLAAVTALALNNLHRREELYSVLKAAKAVTAPLRLPEILNEVIQAARQTAPNLSALTIWYREPEHHRIILGPHFGVSQPKLMQRHEPNENTMVWQVMHAPEPIWATIAQEDPHLRGRFVKDEEIISTAAFPLRANDEKIGAMFFNYRQTHEFTSEEKALFPLLAEIVADCVRDAGQLEATRKERDRLDAARKITEAVGARLDLDEIMRQVMSILRDQLFPDTNICISTYDEVERTLRFTSVLKEFYRIDHPQAGAHFPVPLEKGCIACRVASASLLSKQIEVINIPNVEDDPTYLPLISQTQSEICISLMTSKHELLGVLVLESPQKNRFDEQDEALLRHVSHKISLAMERAYQSANLQFHTTIAATTSWAAEIAHDIRNEVGRIRNRTYWLLEDGDFTEQERIYLEEIDESAQRLAWTVKSADALRNRPLTQVLIDHWIKRMVESFMADKNKRIELTFDLQCPQISIKGIESSLRIALRHLIRNAIEATQEQESCQLIIRTKPVDHQPMIEVQIEDSGSGLDESIRHTLFQKPRSTKDHSDRGFGLLFTRYEIQKMGGTIRCIPATVLLGTCFAFTLPIPYDE